MEGSFSSPSSPAGPRLWRPAAQRSVRNSWSSLSKQIVAWNSSSSCALSSATALVNSILSGRYVKSLNLGVLQEMKGIRTKACKKYFLQGERYCLDLLRSYEDLVDSLSMMLKAKDSMRTYLKGPIGSPLVEFSNQKFLSEDTGDGDGSAVFSSFSLTTHEMLAKEILDMFMLEIQMKWLIVSELHSLLYLGVEDEYEGKKTSERMMQDILVETNLKIPGVTLGGQTQGVDMGSKTILGEEIKREVLQVYLTAWLAEVNIKKRRRDRILKSISDEIQVNLSASV